MGKSAEIKTRLIQRGFTDAEAEALLKDMVASDGCADGYMAEQ